MFDTKKKKKKWKKRNGSGGIRRSDTHKIFLMYKEPWEQRELEDPNIKKMEEKEVTINKGDN